MEITMNLQHVQMESVKTLARFSIRRDVFALFQWAASRHWDYFDTGGQSADVQGPLAFSCKGGRQLAAQHPSNHACILFD